ncbi:MAG: S-layer homology domain-containing protein [Eubacterium sp.]|nr:S-layer homology domain-containing protein [Eubacterium sp.]
MRNMIRRLFVIVMILCISVCFFNTKALADGDSMELDTSIIDKRNEEFTTEYGFSYTDLFNVYTGCLTADTKPLQIVKSVGRDAAVSLSETDLFFAAVEEAVSNNSLALANVYKMKFAEFSDKISTPYEDQLDDLTILYINEVFDNETTLSNAIRKVEGVYSNYRKTHTLKDVKDAFDRDDFNLLIDAYYKDVTTEKELREIKKAVMDREYYISLSLKDEISIAEYYIFLLESYHVNYEVIKTLYDLIPKDTVLSEGLERYLNNYSKLFLPKFCDYIANDVVIDKISDLLLSNNLQWSYAYGEWAVLKVIINVIDYFYDKHMPSATDITRYYLLDGFLSSIDMGLTELRKSMYEDISSQGKVSLEKINNYEFLYNTYIKTMVMYLEAALDITKSSLFSSSETNQQAQIRIIMNSLKRDYSYEYYIELCAKMALGEDIDESSFIISEITCTVKTGQTVNIFSRNGKEVCEYKTENGEITELPVFQGKVFGGIELSGGTINIESDVKSSYLLIHSGTVNTNGHSLESDRVDFLNEYRSTGKLYLFGTGSVISKRDSLIRQVQVIGNGGIIRSDKGIKTESDDKYGGVSFNDCTLIAKQGLSCGGTNYFHNVSITGDTGGGTLSCYGTVKVEGKAGGNYYIQEDSCIEANRFAVNSLYNYGGTIISKGDFSYSGRVTSESDKARFVVYGNLYANGYTAGWWALGLYTCFLQAGTMELYGDLYGVEDVDGKTMWGGPYYYSFSSTSDFVLKLCGNKKQKLILPGTSGSISHLCLENPDVDIQTDLEIDNLYGNMNLDYVTTDIEIKNANGYTINTSGITTGSISLTNGNYNQVGDANGHITIKDGLGNIRGDVKKGITFSNGECNIDGNINGSISVSDGKLFQNGTGNSIDVDSMGLNNSQIVSCSDVTINGGFGMSGTSVLDVNKNLYIYGYTYYYTTGWSYTRYYLLKGGEIRISGDLITGKNEDNRTAFYMYGDSSLVFKNGDHYVSNENNITIKNLKQEQESVIKFNNTGVNIDTLLSDIVVDSSEINISAWNDYSLLNIDSEDIEINFPSDYIKFSGVNDDEKHIKYYSKCNIEGDARMYRSNGISNLDMYSGESCDINFSGTAIASMLGMNDTDDVIKVENNKTLSSIKTGSEMVALTLEEPKVDSSLNVNVLSVKEYCKKYNHKFDDGVVVIDSTCSEMGTKLFTCVRCNTTKNESIQKKPHNTYSLEAVAPTCTSDGLTEGKKCLDCGTVTVSQKVVNRLGHDWDEGEVIKEVSCTEDGIILYRCTRCDSKEERIVTKHHDYQPIEGTYVEPSCTEGGKEADRKCTRCGDIIEGGAINPLGHNEVTDDAVEPTCTEPGLTEGIHCSRCKEIIKPQEEIKALGHEEVIDDAVKASCTEPGLTAGIHCSRCKAIIKAQVENKPALGHDWDSGKVTKEVTCTEDGEKTITCNRCNETKKEIIKAAGHIEEEIPPTEATCVKEGNTKGKKCSVCGEILDAPKVISKTEHSWSKRGTCIKAPTCTEEGIIIFSCSICNNTKIEKMAPLGHDEIVSNPVEPTCTMPGLTEGRRCSRCYEVIKEQEEIPALGHDEVTVDEVPATCAECGFTAYTKCNRCGENITEGTIIEKTKGHIWDSVIISEPTEIHTGLRRYTCRVCGETKEEVIPAIEAENPLEPLTVETIEGVPAEILVYNSCVISKTFNREIENGESFEWLAIDEVNSDGSEVVHDGSAFDVLNCGRIAVIDGDTIIALGPGKVRLAYYINGILTKTDIVIEVFDRFYTPSVPELESVTSNSISVKPMEGCVYSKDGINWQESNVFEDLEPETTYSIVAKKTAKGFTRESNPSKALVVNTVKEIPDTFWPFKDMHPEDTLAEEVRYAYDRGIVGGFGKPDENGLVNYKPERNVTRAQFAIMLYNMAGRPEYECNVADFDDVPVGASGYDEIMWASSNGIISGFSGYVFKPDNPISRTQIAIMLKKYADYMGYEEMYAADTDTNLENYADYNDIKEGSHEYLKWAIDQGVLSGTSSGKLNPNKPARRDHCAAFLARFYSRFIEMK